VCGRASSSVTHFYHMLNFCILYRSYILSHGVFIGVFNEGVKLLANLADLLLAFSQYLHSWASVWCVWLAVGEL